MEGKPQSRLQEVSANEKGRLIIAVVYHCGMLPTGSNTTTRRIRRIVAVLEDIRVGLRSLHGHPAGRVLAKKVRSGQKNLVALYFIRTADTTTTSYLAA